MPAEKATSRASRNGAWSQPQCGSTPEMAKKNTSTTRFSSRFSVDVSVIDDRDRQAREVDLAHEVLAVHDRGHGVAGGLGEVLVGDDAHQQHDRVVLDVRADREHLGEDRVDDAEQHQRPHQAPQVAQRGAEEAQAPVRQREQQAQMREAPPAAREGGGAGHLVRVAERAHVVVSNASGAGEVARSIVNSCGMSVTATLGRVPITSTLIIPSRRSMTLSPEPAWADERRQEVAPGREDVLEAGGQLDLLAGLERAGPMVVPDRRGGEREPLLVVDQRDAEDRVLDVLVEVDR